ncbi:MAG: DOMON-like domain-containing protein [Rhizomicrobium sp.]|nr:DOMON-like domain-containing protein [Rhizomicrobium sp.]
MNRALRLHPECRRAAVSRIDVELRLSQPNQLSLRYVLSGTIDAIAWPAPAPAARADGLWRHSCFEVFVQPVADAGYSEYNFSPSTEWAAYTFDGYRSGMRVLDVPTPMIIVQRDAMQFTLDAEITLPKAFAAPLRLALSAVIEERDGPLSYWALNHPAGKPDFHHADGFTLAL